MGINKDLEKLVKCAIIDIHTYCGFLNRKDNFLKLLGVMQHCCLFKEVRIMKDRKLWKLFITCLMALAILAVPMTVHAEDIFIESLGITVKTKDTPTETVLVDMDNMLTAGDTEAIKAEGTRLGIYNIGLYIEMIDEKDCN